MVRISSWNFARVPKYFGHKYKVSAWNSHKNKDFCNTQISREYFGELAKRQWNNPQVLIRWGNASVLYHEAAWNVYMILPNHDDDNPWDTILPEQWLNAKETKFH